MIRALLLGAAGGICIGFMPLWVNVVFFIGLGIEFVILPALKARG